MNDFVDIKGYNGRYKINRNGEVMTMRRAGTPTKLKPTIKEKGYMRVYLYDTKTKGRGFMVHRLVAETFIPNPENKEQINHYQKSKFYPSEELRAKLIELGVPRNKHDIVSLGEMLPNKVKDYWIICGKDKDGWFCAYNKPQGGKANYIHLITEQTEADARAKMLIWLIENKYLDPKEEI